MIRGSQPAPLPLSEQRRLFSGSSAHALWSKFDLRPFTLKNTIYSIFEGKWLWAEISFMSLAIFAPGWSGPNFCHQNVTFTEYFNYFAIFAAFIQRKRSKALKSIQYTRIHYPCRRRFPTYTWLHLPKIRKYLKTPFYLNADIRFSPGPQVLRPPTLMRSILLSA